MTLDPPAKLNEKWQVTFNSSLRRDYKQLTLAVDDSTRRFLAKAGYDPQFGARPLKRAIQQHLLDPLALRLLEGDFKPGDAIAAEAKNDSVEFSLAE